MKENYDDFKNSILAQWPMNSHMREVELRRKEYEQRIALDERALETCRRRGNLQEFHDYAHNQLVMSLRASIYGKDHPKRHVIRYPKDWWEAVKERFAPAWFRDRHPVEFIEVTASLEELYPEIEPDLPDRMPVMKFYVETRTDTPVW